MYNFYRYVNIINHKVQNPKLLSSFCSCASDTCTILHSTPSSVAICIPLPVKNIWFIPFFKNLIYACNYAYLEKYMYWYTYINTPWLKKVSFATDETLQKFLACNKQSFKLITCCQQQIRIHMYIFWMQCLKSRNFQLL